MSDSMSGSLVFKLEPLAPAAQVLAINDVVLAIEDEPIADDGTIEFRDEERVDFAYQVRGKHIGPPACKRFPDRRTMCSRLISRCPGGNSLSCKRMSKSSGECQGCHQRSLQQSPVTKADS